MRKIFRNLAFIVTIGFASSHVAYANPDSYEIISGASARQRAAPQENFLRQEIERILKKHRSVLSTESSL